jgi:hypothetical protein
VIRIKPFIVLSLVALLSACSFSDELDSLDKTLRAYEHSLRWSRLELVAQYYKEPVKFSEREKERLKKIQVTAYKVLSTNASKTKARQVVEIRYFNSEYAIERELTDVQQWEYDPELERWSLVSPFPRFK